MGADVERESRHQKIIMAQIYRYTHAVVCRLPDSFKTNALGTVGTIDLNLAKEQHAIYVSSLRRLGLDVIELPSDEALPDCVFVEDTAVVVNGTAFITRPGHVSRRNEAIIMKSILQKEIGLPIVELSDPNATIDGGDVLFTGREFFVGLSTWANIAGARGLAAAFPEYPCTPVKVSGDLHLKSLVTMAGPDIILVSKTKNAEDVLKVLILKSCVYQDDYHAYYFLENGERSHIPISNFTGSRQRSSKLSLH